MKTKFKKMLTTTSILIVMLVLFATSHSNLLNAQLAHYIGPVNASNVPTVTTTQSYWPYGTYNYAKSIAMYSKNELAISGQNVPYFITSLSMYIHSITNSTGTRVPTDVYLLLKNTPVGQSIDYPIGAGGCPSTSSQPIYATSWLDACIADGYTLVKGPMDVDVSQTLYWHEYEFDAPFYYDGVSNLSMIMLCTHGLYSSSTGAGLCKYPVVRAYNGQNEEGGYGYGYQYSSTYPPPSPTSNSYYCYSYAYPTPYTASRVRPYLKLEYELPSGPYSYYGSVCSHAINFTIPDKVDIPVLTTAISVVGDTLPYQQIDRLRFDGKNSIENNQITKAKLYYTTTNGFSTDNLVGEISNITTSNINNLVFDITPIELGLGNNYFWLTYDIHPNAPNSTIDAKLIDFDLFTIDDNNQRVPTLIDPPTDTKDPEGEVTISTFQEIYCGAVNTLKVPVATTTSVYWPYYYYNFNSSATVYGQDELGGYPGLITNIAMYIKTVYNPTYADKENIYLLFKNVPLGTAASFSTTTAFPSNMLCTSSTTRYGMYWLDSLLAAGYEIVKGPFEFNPSTTGYWHDMELDVPYHYEGNELSVIMLYDKEGSGMYYGSNAKYHYVSVYGTGAYRYNYTTTNPPISSSNYTCSGPYSGTHKPNLRINIDYTPGQKYRRSNVEQMTGLTSVGASNVPILKVNIVATGALTENDIYQHLEKMSFDGKNSFDYGQATQAKLYYTGNDPVFSVSNQIGNTVLLDNANVGSINFELSEPLKLIEKNNYFWLAYDIAEEDNIDADGKTVDAKLNYFNLFTYDEDKINRIPTGINPETTNKDPEGEITIKAPLWKGIYYVGPATVEVPNPDYETLAECALACTEIGVNKPTEIILTDNLTEKEVSIFGLHRHLDKNPSITIRPYPGKAITINITATETTNDAGIWLQGNTNFTIDGSNDYTINGNAVTVGETSNQGLTIKRGFTTIRAENGSHNFTLRNTIVESAIGRTAVIVAGSDNIELSNNNISKAFNGFHLTGINGLNLTNSYIGSLTDASTCVQAGMILRNVKNANISHNKIINIKGSTSSHGTGMMITDTLTAFEPLSINIFNNIIYNVNTASTSGRATAFYFQNASDINLYHNTVILNKTSGQETTTIFWMGGADNNVKINSKNNLFINAVNSTTSSIVLSGSLESFNNLDNNLYSSIKSFKTNFTNTENISFAQWQNSLAENGTGKNDANSYLSLKEGNFLFPNNSDFHIDGEIILTKGSLVPVLSEVEYDIDNIKRGQLAGFEGLTTAGADEAIIVIRDKEPNVTYLPSEEVFCSGDEGYVLLAIDDKEFSNVWSDGIMREVLPVPHNQWEDEYGNILDEESINNCIVNYPYFYIESPVYTQSCRLRAITTIGNYVDTSDYCDLRIIKTPEVVSNQPEKLIVCSNAGYIDLESTIDGTYQSLQWQKQNGTQWEDVSGQTLSTLHLTFSTQPEMDAIKGNYRLKITPYNLCDAPSNVYSEVTNITVGNPLTEVVIRASNTSEELLALCGGDGFWFTASIPQGNDGTVLGYQWQKYDDVIDEFIDISSVVNPTASLDTFKVIASRSDDAGTYRCLVLGPSNCPVGASLPTEGMTVGIKNNMQIITQPEDMSICNESLTIIEPVVSGENNTYQWYKDGVKLEDQTNMSLDFGEEGAKFSDAGKYTLQIFYENCFGEPDSTYTNSMQLFVYGPTEIVEQTTTISAVEGGFAKLRVNVATVGDEYATAPVTYQWYRKTNNSDEALKNNHYYTGVNSSVLVINNIDDNVINKPGDTNDYYYCVVTGLCDEEEITSSPIVIKTAPKISITDQPIDVQICEGEEAVFTVNAQSSDPTLELKYQWYYVNGTLVVDDGVNISGAQTNSLTIANATLADANDYYLIVEYVTLGAPIPSITVNLLVEAAPIVTNISKDTALFIGETLELSVDVDVQYPGYVCDYQWYYNDNPIIGATSEKYTVDSVTKSDSGYYYVVLTSFRDCGETISDTINVNVKTTGINDTKIADFSIISVMPNPITSDAIVKFELPDSQFANLKLLDGHGRTVLTVFEGMGLQGENEVRLEKLSHLSNGSYFLILESKGHSVTFPIMINK